MAEETRTSPGSFLPSSWAACQRAARSASLSRFQAVVGTVAGIVSITGAAFSLVQFLRPPTTGDLVTIVQAAGSRASVTDATVEVLTTQNAVVSTLTSDATGRVSQPLREGTYVVRVSHPGYAADVRRVEVAPRQTVEVRASLRAGSSSPMERAANTGVSAVRRILRF